MKTYKKNAVVIGVLFIFTMLAGMIDAYIVAPVFQKSIVHVLLIDNKILLGVFSILVMAIGIELLAISFFPVIKQQSETIAITYITLRTIECILLILGAICYLYILALGKTNVNDTNISSYVIAIALVLKIKYYGFQLAMIVLGFGSICLCYLLYVSRLVPRFLSVWGGIGYMLLLSSAVLEICGVMDTTKGLGAMMYVPGGLWEMLVFPCWLFMKGFDLPKQ